MADYQIGLPRNFLRHCLTHLTLEMLVSDDPDQQHAEYLRWLDTRGGWIAITPDEQQILCETGGALRDMPWHRRAAEFAYMDSDVQGLVRHGLERVADTVETSSTQTRYFVNPDLRAFFEECVQGVAPSTHADDEVRQIAFDAVLMQHRATAERAVFAKACDAPDLSRWMSYWLIDSLQQS